MPRTLRDGVDDAPPLRAQKRPNSGGARRAPSDPPLGRGQPRERSGVRRRPSGLVESGRPPKNQRRQPKPPPIAPIPEVDPEVRGERFGRLRRGFRRALPALRLAGRLLFAAACVAGLWSAFHLLQRHTLTSPYFAVDDLSVEGMERMTRAQLLEAAGLVEGQNIFQVSPVQAQRRLEALPWVASASVERRLPRRLELSVVEHHAAFLLSLSQLYLVDRDGSVFSELSEDDPVDLPVLTGLDEVRFRGDLRYRTVIVARVAQLLEDVRAAGLYRRMPLQEIHLGADDGLSLVMGDEALLVSLGEAPYGQKLRRLRRVLDSLEDRHQRAERVFLNNEHRPSRVVVRLAANFSR